MFGGLIITVVEIILAVIGLSRTKTKGGNRVIQNRACQRVKFSLDKISNILV